MRILWLFKYKPGWDFNRWFHMNFADSLAEQPGIELKSYGQGMSYNYPKYDLQKYYNHISIKEIKENFNFDIIIMDGKARMTVNNISRTTVLPKNFAEFKDTPKIMIEGDFHNYKNSADWYEKQGVNIILHRHKTNVERGKKLLPNIKHIYFPCSVNEKIFKPNSNIERKNQLCFIGGLNPCYKYRKEAVKILQKKDLIKVYPRRMFGQKYINCMQSYICHVNGSSIFDLDIAKMFEIMASGSVLLTDNCSENGVKELFDKESYVTYERDYSDLIDKAKRIIEDEDYRKKITEKAIKCINERHTHTVRAQQLLEIISNEFNLL